MLCAQISVQRLAGERRHKHTALNDRDHMPCSAFLEGLQARINAGDARLEDFLSVGAPTATGAARSSGAGRDSIPSGSNVAETLRQLFAEAGRMALVRVTRRRAVKTAGDRHVCVMAPAHVESCTLSTLGTDGYPTPCALQGLGDAAGRVQEALARRRPGERLVELAKRVASGEYVFKGPGATPLDPDTS